MNNKEKIVINTKSIGFFGLLQLIFIVLKLTNVINWSWIIVLLPIIVYAIIILIVVAILFIFVKD